MKWKWQVKYTRPNSLRYERWDSGQSNTRKSAISDAKSSARSCHRANKIYHKGTKIKVVITKV
jgi:hypothetical protein